MQFLPESKVFIEAIFKEFTRLFIRINSQRVKAGKPEIPLKLDCKINDRNLWVVFARGSEENFIQIPLPWQEKNGITKIGNRIERVFGTFMITERETEISYLELIYQILTNAEFSILGANLPKANLMEEIIKCFDSKNRQIITEVQRTINIIVNSLPLHEHDKDLLSWSVNNRVVFLDPIFKRLNPDQKLLYQIHKNVKYFDRGWTSIGLSDSTLSTQNYILKKDIRANLCPFGTRHHNPQRNLYQTLGIKGNELPVVRTKFEEELIEKGITRTGWNLMTVFLDLPLNFEDQIIVRKNLAKDLVSKHYRTFTCWGVPTLKTGDFVKKGDIISVEPNDEPLIFKQDCDKATIINISEELVPLNNKPHVVKIVTIKIERFFRDGSKITNLHGNKGIIRLAETGVVWDPVRQMNIPIDIIVSGKGVRKRNNFGQLVEAIFTLTKGINKPTIIPEDMTVTTEDLERMVKEAGYPKTELSANTTWGTFDCVAGWVFWGNAGKDPEDQIWDRMDLDRKNGKDMRVAGVKASHIEMKSMLTTFGPKSGVIKEILSHSQGSEEVKEKLIILSSMENKFPKNVPVLSWEDVPYIETNGKTMFEPFEIMGTIADEGFMQNGFVMELPWKLQCTLFWNPLEPPYEGLPNKSVEFDCCRTIHFNKIYIPKGFVRRQWVHPTGCVGINDISLHLNRFLSSLRRNPRNDRASIRLVFDYFNFVRDRLSTKSGNINQFVLGVRQPNSVKAVATCSETLPENWIEIHRDMARDLKVRTGDHVIVERFPCLGFMSMRVQKVRVTDEEQCRFTVRVSGNSLTSLSLDFDGDVIYLYSFETLDAKLELENEFKNPHPFRTRIIDERQSKKVPMVEALSLRDYNIKVFDDLTVQDQIEIVNKAVGVKAHTGPVIALAYNLMRIVESDISYEDIETHASIEDMLDFLGNTVFSQKHGVESLHRKAIDAICLCDIDKMVEMGFERKPTEIIVGLIRKKAAQFCRIKTQAQLEAKHREHLEKGKSNIISTIVRRQNKFYFATRANLHPIRLLEHLRSKPVDLTSHMFHYVMGQSK